MKFLQNKTKKFRSNLIFVLPLAALAIGLGAVGWFNHRAAAGTDYHMELPAQSALESHVLFGGDVFWGRSMYDWSQQSPLKEAYPFSRLKEFQREKYDAWVVNLECPSVPGVKQPIGFVPKLHEFNCDTDYLPNAAKWFTAVSLGNNHTSNQGRESGLEATRQQLDAHGIQHFGDFNPHKTDKICSVIGLPARAQLDGHQQNVTLPVAMCGFHGVHYTITDKAVAEMQRYARYMPVVAMPHMGREYQASVDDKRKDLYHKMIDNGADVVFGNHPHWVQPAEAYKGKLIAYSMGNFIFDQDFSPEVMRSAAFDTTLSLAVDGTNQDQLKAWLRFGDSCKSSQDSCLSQAEQQGLQRLPIKFSYSIVGVDLSNKITHRANQRLQDDILTRLNWKAVNAQLAK